MRYLIVVLILLNLLYLAFNLSRSESSLDIESTNSEVLLRDSVDSGERLVLLEEAISRGDVLIRSTSVQAIDDQVQELRELEINSTEVEGQSAVVVQGEDSASDLTGVEGIIESDQSETDEELAMCYSLLGLPDEEQLQALVERLQSQGIDVTVSEAEVLDFDYRVYMPPFNSRALAQQRYEELQQSGVDSYIIGDGELTGGISLGFFTQIEQAQTLQQELAELGYPSSIEVVEDLEAGVSIDISPQIGVEIPAILAEEISNSDIELNLVEKLCETIAPEA